MSCPHCGFEHAPGTAICPRSGEPTNKPGVIGTRIDRYELKTLLGTGGFGSVYRAKHVHTDAEVALKVLKRALNADQAMIDRFLREAKAAASVGNDHIVGVLDAGVASDGTAFLALELLDGWDLKELVTREGPQSPARLIGLIAQVLDGLAAAHDKGIVHRDMKPANVFVVQRRGTDFVKLLDFGISKMHAADGAVAGLTMTGVAMGTPAYMAPEQFFDARGVDGRADLYAVAAMLYELLARRLPFEAQSYAELVVKVKTEVPPPLRALAPLLPESVSSAVDRGLARDPAARWQTAREFATVLRQTLSHPELQPAAATGTPRPLATPMANSPSMMLGATAPPRQSQPPARLDPTSPPRALHTPQPAPAPVAAQTPTPAPAASGWLGQTGPSAPPTPGLVSGAVPAVVASAGAPQAKKAGPGGLPIWAWVVISIGALFTCCCGLGAIGAVNDQQKKQDRHHLHRGQPDDHVHDDEDVDHGEPDDSAQ